MAYRQPSAIRLDTELSPEEKRLVQERAKLRAQLKQEYVRQVTDPHKHGKGGGVLVPEQQTYKGSNVHEVYKFDPQMVRFHAARANSQIYEHFRPTLKGGWQWFAITILPMIALGYVTWNDRKEFERKCRTGEIPYKDRMFKMA